MTRRLPTFSDTAGIRNPADWHGVRDLVQDHTLDELSAMKEEAEREYWRAADRARWILGPLGFLCTLTVMFLAGTAVIVLLAPTLLSFSSDGLYRLFIALGLIMAVGGAGAAVLGLFDRLRDRLTRDKLIRAHSLRAAHTIRLLLEIWDRLERREDNV